MCAEAYCLETLARRLCDGGFFVGAEFAKERLQAHIPYVCQDGQHEWQVFSFADRIKQQG